jgi:hypothetical protein
MLLRPSFLFQFGTKHMRAFRLPYFIFCPALGVVALYDFSKDGALAAHFYFT